MNRQALGPVGGFADQAIVSLGNFGLNVSLARALSAADYGAFSIALSFILVFNTLHQALIAYPLSVRGAAARPMEYRRLLCVAAMLTPICALAFLPALGAGLFSVSAIDLLPLAFFALAAWQLHEVFRRGMLAQGHFWSAIVVDLVRYIGTFVAALALAAGLTSGGAFLLIGASALVAIAPAALDLRGEVGSVARTLPAELAGHWRMAAPVLGANLLAALSTQWFLWLLAWFRNPGEAAVLVALANIVAISSPVIFGVENILVPEIARGRDTLTFANLLHLVGRRVLLSGAMIAPFFLLILAFPQQAARLFYGAATPYAAYPGALRILVAAYASYLGAYVFGAVLRGYRASGAVFKMQLYPALLGLSLGTWLTWRYGVEGACAASFLAGLLRAAVGFHCVLRLRMVTAAVAPALAAS